MSINTNNLGYFSTSEQDTNELTLQEVNQPNIQTLGYFSEPVIETQDETKMPTRDVSTLGYFSSPEISLSREIAFGQAQEPLALGSAYRIAQAGIGSLFNRNETYEEARKRIEDARQKKYLKSFRSLEVEKKQPVH